MLSSIKAGTAPATLKKVTHRQLVKTDATVRNQTVTYGGVTPLELAFGRRPADLIQLDVATPTQLTIDRADSHPDQAAVQASLPRSASIRRHPARPCSKSRMSSKPLQVKDKVFDWQEDESKIRSDGSKGGIWLKGKVISIEGAMVGLDLGTRLIKVNMTKVRKDETIPPGKPGIDLLLPEERESLQKEQTGSSAVETHKITATTMSTTVAELHGLMHCYGSALFLRGCWSDITGEIADAHIRTDANNLVTAASTTHQPEQKETMHLIQMLRKESNSGQMHDLAHVRSEDCLADSLTKHSAKADELIKAVLTGNLLNVDAHPPFRTMLQNKAFLVEWLAHNTKHGPDIIAFAGVGIAESMFAYWGTWA